jgi:hypothetical protein
MDAPRPAGGAPAPRAPHSPAPEPQRKSRQQSSLFRFFRRASRVEVEEQAAERMEVIAVAVHESWIWFAGVAAFLPWRCGCGASSKSKKSPERIN